MTFADNKARYLRVLLDYFVLSCNKLISYKTTNHKLTLRQNSDAIPYLRYDQAQLIRPRYWRLIKFQTGFVSLLKHGRYRQVAWVI